MLYKSLFVFWIKEPKTTAIAQPTRSFTVLGNLREFRQYVIVVCYEDSIALQGTDNSTSGAVKHNCFPLYPNAIILVLSEELVGVIVSESENVHAMVSYPNKCCAWP